MTSHIKALSLLAFDTSCERASLALWHGGEALERTLMGAPTHSERILSELHALLAEAGIALSALDAIAFGAGPGAFTGVRLACAVAQGLAMGAGLGVVPVGSLQALACQGQGAHIFAATDARMGEVYCASFAIEDGLPVPLDEPRCLPPEHCVLPPGDDWFVLGSAFAAYPDRLTGVPGARVRACLPDVTPRAADVARLAERALRLGAATDPTLAAPLYVRDKVALTTEERLARGGRA